ncbi:MAG: HAD-IB family phosphatase [Deltaproteobacteria bacterium]|jgi:HAD superfamily phosphoserine phosphatase-like hydrolase|nr:HAD-IB family phosphatase [Deltaproteobacteria bacterium]
MIQEKKRPLFAFDLDGTITREEMLPRLAARLGMEREISILTAKTLSGEIPFETSFRKRFSMLRRLPLRVIHEEVRAIGLDGDIEAFIRRRPEDCVIVTGNLDRWIQPLVEPLGCMVRCSVSRPAGDENDTAAPNALELASVLDKGEALRELRTLGRPLVAIGESVSDVSMFREADLGLAFAGVHRPVPELLARADRVFYCGRSLCVFLEKLENQV